MIKKYIFIFSTVYIILSILLLILLNFIDLPNTTIAIVSIMAAAIFTVQSFVKEQSRAPDTSEKNQLVWGCLISTIAIGKLTKTTKHAKRHFWLTDVCTCHGLLPSHSA